MIDERTKKDLKEFDILEDDRFYIYIMENNIKKIKIGRTGNIQQRYDSLGGSNGQGNKITRVCCSPATYLYTIENIMHDKFKEYRIEGTEWFDGLKFETVMSELEKLFRSDEYKICNKTRKNYNVLAKKSGKGIIKK